MRYRAGETAAHGGRSWISGVPEKLFDPSPQSGPWEPSGPSCKGCRRPILHDQPRELLRFAAHPEHDLEDMNGLYHAECAKPLLSIKRALDMLSRPWG